MAKYQVVKGGYSNNGNSLLVGQVFEGIDKGAKFLSSPAITLTYMGRAINVPSSNLQLVADETPLSNTAVVAETNNSRMMIKSVMKLAGLGAGVYFAHKGGKGAWGYIGFGLLGIIGGAIVGGMVANIVVKKV